MKLSKNSPDWCDRFCASFIFFTRIPFWKLRQPPLESYSSVTEYWPLTGWLTATITAIVLYFGNIFFPYPVAIILAMASRILLTGGLHEDGLCDFFDGFGGGGTDKKRILLIMKDSRVGTYGVLGLVVYELLVFSSLLSMPVHLAIATILAADPFAKMLASQTITMLPYAKSEDESKNGVIYRRMNLTASILLAFQGLIPIVIYIYLFHNVVEWQRIVFVPCLVMYFLYLFIRKRLNGYTGDCCGAIFLLIELSFFLATTSCLLT